jgi:hypothetical protein
VGVTRDRLKRPVSQILALRALRCPRRNSAPVSVPGLFLCRRGDGKGGGHPFDVEVRCRVLAVVWGGSLQYPVEAQYLSNRNAPIISVPDCGDGEYN